MIALGRPHRQTVTWGLIVATPLVLALVAMALAGGATPAAVAFGAIFLLASVECYRLSHRTASATRRIPGALAVEVPIVLLLISTYASLPRSVAALETNPLGSLGMVRLACLGGALLLGFAACATGTARRPPLDRSFAIYALYVGVVFLGVATSIRPALTAYRGVELLAGLLVITGAYFAGGPMVLRRLERFLFAVTVVLILSAWLSVLVSPHAALVPTPKSPIPWQVEGQYPPIASNGLGTLGVLLALWTLGLHFGSAEDRRELRPALVVFLTVLGVVTELAAQYRTGYAMLAVGILLLLALRARTGLAVALGVAVILIGAVGASRLSADSKPILLRGDTTAQAETLSGRLSYCNAAIPFWRRSPVFGGGLLTATRLQVLPSIGVYGTGTIHSTWVETLVGTGLAGTIALAAAFLVFLRGAFREALSRGGRLVPALFVTALLIRSGTGDSIDHFGLYILIFLTFAAGFSVSSQSRGQPER